MADKRLQELIKAQDAAYELLMDNRKRFDECVMFGAKVGSRVFLMNTLADMYKAEAGLLEASIAVALRAFELQEEKLKAKREGGGK